MLTNTVFSSINKLANSRVFFPLVVVVWLAVTLPLVNLGYGSDVDAWIVANNGENIWESHTYSSSRSMGFPLFELAITPLVHLGGWMASNLASVVAGLFFLGAVWALVRLRHLRHSQLTFLVLAFHPLIIINSTTTMDYVWAVSSLGWAYVALLSNKPLAAGVLIGIATGFRPTSILFAGPAILWFAWQRQWKYAAIVAAISLLMAVFAYSPALIEYGLSTDRTSGILPGDLSAKDLVLLMGYNLTFAIGLLQTVWVVGLISIVLWRRRNIPAVNSSAPDPFLPFHLAVVFIWIALFLTLPVEPEYLLPAFLSLLLLCDRFLSARLMAVTVILLLSYHLVRVDLLGGESGDRRVQANIEAGYTIAHIQERRHILSIRELSTEYDPPTKTILMYGEASTPLQNDAWARDSDLDLWYQIDGDFYVTLETADLETLRFWSEKGFRIVAWNKRKSFLTRSGDEWRKYVEIVELEDFFGRRVKGKIFQ